MSSSDNEAYEILDRLFPTVADMIDESERVEAKVVEATAPLPERVELVEFSTTTSGRYTYITRAKRGQFVCLPEMPRIEISKRPRERNGRSGCVLAGWSVRIGGVEIDRKPTKRAARVRLDEWLAEHLRKLSA